ncbi:trans-1,2-dihydrobenzene-1,2-diol dehydrogenase-like isoform X2 [Sitodiplosis mosellana]|uniref:trans-1,2-dihydrobenzene-1,2-diol dehydrogenase-like isoform X2 n=1 Tax=Sitodiplosis mosellana TaxID=263140 RepID=UPI002444778F|nr:trans-1,2-dihydrobenzene-1,2-diol dehydrogenase-like isoform X2 [Sitodiplosis mosellana]
MEPFLIKFLRVSMKSVETKTKINPKPFKWGLVTAGNVSHDFANALGTLDPEVHQVVAVAGRDLERVKQFAQKFEIPKAYGSYLELAQDPDVDVAYIGTINPQHVELTQLMLDHGKHVLLEKPLTMNEKQAQKLIAYAKEKGLFLMEALWSRYLPSFQYVREQVQRGALGEILSVEAELGLDNMQFVERAIKKEFGGGTVLDIGVYPIQLCQWIFQQAPTSIKAAGKLNDDGVDLEMSAVINYGDNKVCKIRTSFTTTYKNGATIVGSKGQITMPLFWITTSIIDVDGTKKTWPLPKPKYDTNFMNSAGFRYEAEAVRQSISEGKLENEVASHAESLQLARIEDEIRRQIGVRYPQDD